MDDIATAPVSHENPVDKDEVPPPSPPIDKPSKASPPVPPKQKKGGKQYEARVQELFDKYLPQYEKAYFSGNKEGKCGDVISRVVNEAEFQFQHLFDPLRDPNAPPPSLPALRPYDPLAPIAEVTWSKEDINKRKVAVSKWTKKARNYFHHRVHVVKPENDKKKPTKIGAAMNGLVRPSKARAGYQLYEVELGQELGRDVARLWEERSADVVKKDDDAHAQMNAKRVAEGLAPKAKREGPTIAFRQRIVRERFNNLTAEERADFENRAKAEAKDKREEYEEAIKKPIEHSPEQRQHAIDNIGALVSPLIEDIRRHTGLHIIVSAYGPLPSTQGQLGVLTWSAGRNRDAVPMSFLKKCPQAAAAHRARLLAYAATAFTDEDIAAACPGPDSVLSMKSKNDMEFELDDDALVRKGEKRRRTVRSQHQSLHTSGTDIDEDDPVDINESKSSAAATTKASSTVTRADSTPQPSTTTRRKRRRPSHSDSDSDSESDGEDDGFDQDGDGTMDMDIGSGGEGTLEEDEAPPAPKKPKLSQYEIDREANIAAHKALFESLGLNDAAKDFKKSLGQAGATQTKTRKRPAAVEQRVRRSSRLQGEGDPGTSQSRQMSVENGPVGAGMVGVTSELPATVVHTRPKPRQAFSKKSTDSAANTNTQASEHTAVRDGGDAIEEGQAADQSKQVAFGFVDMEGLEMDNEAILEEAAELLIEAPVYMSDALRRMKEKDVGMLGQAWDVLLARLLLLESEGEFNMPLKDLPTGNAKDGTLRPPMLKAWLKVGRCRRNAENVPKEMPLLDPGDLKAHVAAFWGWWGMMQPAWRRYEGGKWARNGYDGAVDLGNLNTRGSCGWLSVVACMWWWGVCVHEGEDESAKKAWEAALADVDWMLTVVLLLGEREGKEE